MSKRDGLSQQLKRKQPSPKEGSSNSIKFTYAGLPPALYTDLHSLPGPDVIFGNSHQDMEAKLATLRRKRDKIQQAFDAASNVLGKCQTNSRDYTDLLLVLDILSSCLAEVCQQLAKVEAVLASITASEQLAYSLQMEEVNAHLQFVGRLDQPRPSWPEDDVRHQRQPRQPRRPRGLVVRSINVPSPIRHRLPVENRVPELARPLTQRTITEYIPPEYSPSRHNEAMLETPETEIQYRRCPHARLHRLNLSADKNARRQLRMACKASCGNSTSSRFTLWPPLPVSRQEQIRQLPDVVVVAQPDVVVANQPQPAREIAISQSVANEQPDSTQAENLNETIELNTSPTAVPRISSSPVRSCSSSSSPARSISSPSSGEVIQLDGHGYDQDHSYQIPSPDLSFLWSLPRNRTRSPASYSSPRGPRPCDGVFGRASSCSCELWRQEGWCAHGTEGNYVNCNMGSPYTPSDLVRRLNQESFARIAAIKRQLFSVPDSTSEPSDDEPEPDQ